MALVIGVFRRLRLGRPRTWVALAGICVLAFLYYRPVRAYMHTRRVVAARTAEVRSLAERKAELEQRLQLSQSGATLVRAARRLGLVKAGERLFIVKGIAEWRRAHRSSK